MNANYKNLTKYTTLALKQIFKERPTCADLLKAKKEWALNYSDVRDDIAKMIDMDKDYDINTEFIQYFLKAKSEYNENDREITAAIRTPQKNKIVYSLNIHEIKEMPKPENNRLKNNFKNESEPIGIGSYGLVTSAIQNMDNIKYAIKKKIVKDQADFDRKNKEVMIFALANNDLFVQYKSSWLEHPDPQDRDKFLRQMMYEFQNICSEEFEETKRDKDLTDFYLLYIQMDLCLFSLRELMDKITKYFSIAKGQLLSPVPYYVASEILIEILESINYMHKLSPPIIHRDIRPENILIKNGRNAKFIKIAGFGLACFHYDPDLSHTSTSGAINYMAPEVKTGRRYDTRADVYSIGIIISELFNLNIYETAGIEMNANYENLLKYATLALKQIFKQRATCADLLKAKKEWALNYSDVRDDIAKMIDMDKDYDINTEFIQYFLKAKTEYNENK